MDDNKTKPLKHSSFVRIEEEQNRKAELQEAIKQFGKFKLPTKEEIEEKLRKKHPQLYKQMGEFKAEHDEINRRVESGEDRLKVFVDRAVKRQIEKEKVEEYRRVQVKTVLKPKTEKEEDLTEPSPIKKAFLTVLGVIAIPFLLFGVIMIIWGFLRFAGSVTCEILTMPWIVITVIVVAYLYFKDKSN